MKEQSDANLPHAGAMRPRHQPGGRHLISLLMRTHMDRSERARRRQSAWLHDRTLINPLGLMIRPHVLAVVMLTALLSVAACTRPPAPTIAGDGDYRGTVTRFQALRRTCPRPGFLNISVRNGTMFYRWGDQYIQVAVLNNGTLSGSLPGVQLTGTHDGTVMQGDVSDGQCGLHFTVRRVAN